MKYLGIYAEWIDGKEIAKGKTIDVINCKDCKYGSKDPFDMRPIWCFNCDHYRHETDFCSRGERREFGTDK